MTLCTLVVLLASFCIAKNKSESMTACAIRCATLLGDRLGITILVVCCRCSDTTCEASRQSFSKPFRFRYQKEQFYQL